jgi:hydroxymethylpyrimidine kinase/phosphomethylpyrimidine kinase
VLSIGGSDPSGGAGIQADLKTFEALGVDGCAVPVALTVQNRRGVTRIETLSAELAAEQCDAVFADADVRAVKIGMLATADMVRTVADVLRRHVPPFVVLDPVVRATSGAQLLSDEGLHELRRNLLPLVTLVTPNAAEAGALAACAAPHTIADARLVAERVRVLAARNVVVTGGHTDGGDDVVDVLVGECGSSDARAPRVNLTRTHGTGCRYSSAVAALVARGASLSAACAGAQRFVGGWLAESADSMRYS